MKSETQQFSFTEYKVFKNKMLNWASRFNIFCFLDNNGYQPGTEQFDCILAAGSRRFIKLEPKTAFEQLKFFYDSEPSWLFGHLGYALDNEEKKVKASKKDEIDFGTGFFFEPEVLIKIRNNELTITSATHNVQEIFEAIEQEPPNIAVRINSTIKLQNSISQKEYMTAVANLQHHILRGDCYEINFCQRFFAEDAIIDPLYTYHRLTEFSPNPFSALYKLNDKYCLCASPERYLQKSGQTIISQPIKGTSKRNLLDKNEDEASRNYLISSAKEKSENVMVVDLVRNDLSRICEEGSVQVKELFGIYSFPQVHQMISTIQGIIKKELHWTDAIKATFPMGSMTGAPKKRVMELIDEYETAARGLFSGTIGYVTPDDDFDFNVVIRSIFYDAANRKLSFSAGGGITFNSNAEEEYKESMLKAEAILQVLQLQ